MEQNNYQNTNVTKVIQIYYYNYQQYKFYLHKYGENKYEINNVGVIEDDLKSGTQRDDFHQRKVIEILIEAYISFLIQNKSRKL